MTTFVINGRVFVDGLTLEDGRRLHEGFLDVFASGEAQSAMEAKDLFFKRNPSYRNDMILVPNAAPVLVGARRYKSKTKGVSIVIYPWYDDFSNNLRWDRHD